MATPGAPAPTPQDGGVTDGLLESECGPHQGARIGWRQRLTCTLQRNLLPALEGGAKMIAVRMTPQERFMRARTLVVAAVLACFVFGFLAWFLFQARLAPDPGAVPASGQKPALPARKKAPGEESPVQAQEEKIPRAPVASLEASETKE